MSIKLKIDDILLSLDNPRLEEAKDQEQALSFMVANQGEKIYRLAEDIAKNGLSPLDTIAVYPSMEYKGKYVVAEGNRRITAIKILNNPVIISLINDSLFRKFLSLRDIYKNLITEVEAVVFNNPTDEMLTHWIETRHMGEQYGIGVARWNSKQKMRFDKKVRQVNTLIDFWNELESKGILTSKEIESITITNWNRILRPTGRRFLGLDYINGSYIIPVNNLADFIKKIRAVQKKLAHKTVSIVYGEDDIKAFIKSVADELDIQTPVTEQLEIENNSANLEQKSVSDNINVNQTLNKSPYTASLTDGTNVSIYNRSNDLFENSKTIIPKNYKIKSNSIRISKIIHELKTLSVDEFPNSCGALLRLLFELSAKNFLESREKQDFTELQFEQVIRKSANILVESKLLHSQQHSALMKDISLLRSLFNGYMHNTNQYPSSEALKSIFKAHIRFIEACLTRY
jgi:hypothetical protein